MEGELRFRRNDLHTVGTNNKGTLKVYPPGKKSRQKVAIGDMTGVVQVIQVGKHHNVEVQFVTPKMEKPVTSIDLFTDQLFVASGGKINAYSRKGKAFFGFETNMTESINSLKIDTPNIFAGGEYVMTHFQESTELGFYMAPDRINQLTHWAAPDGSGSFDVFLACQDRQIRTIKSQKCASEVPCESPVTAITKLTNKAGDRQVIYGTLAGTVGAFKLSNTNNELGRLYTAVPQSRMASITAVHSVDVNLDGHCDVVVGRDDGAVEVHTFHEDPNGEPKVAWSTNLGEVVNSVDAGMITTTARDEVIVSTYSGKVVSFSLNEDDAQARAVVPTVLQGAQSMIPEAARIAPSKDPEQPSNIEITAQKMKETQAEIEHLRQLLRQKQTEFSSASTTTQTGTIKAISSEFTVQDKFVLDSSANLALSIVVDTPIDHIALQADVALEILDTEGAQLSLNPNKDGQNKMMCVLRGMEENTKRIEVRFRSIEGQYGTLRAFVVPKTLPRTAQLRTYTIRPLALHQRISEGDVQWSSLPLSTLRINGNFSVKDGHSWVYTCLPEVPEMIHGDSMTLAFRNTFQQTVLMCRYSRGEAEFMSENLSTLAVLKEVVTREATLRKIPVKIVSEPRSESVLRHLQLLDPQLTYQHELVSKVKFIDALKEIEGQESDTAFLSDDYKQILGDVKSLEEEHKLQPKRMEYLKDLLQKLLYDRAMFRGEGAPHNLTGRLYALIDDYDAKRVQDFFLV